MDDLTMILKRLRLSKQGEGAKKEGRCKKGGREGVEKSAQARPWGLGLEPGTYHV